MVERTKTEALTEFIGEVKDIRQEDSDYEGEKSKQFHIEMKPLNVEVAGSTGMFHEWLRISKTTTDTSVPEGSVMDRYLQALEVISKEVKVASSIYEALVWMKGKVFEFKKVRHGREFQGKPAKEYWTPVRMLSKEEADKVTLSK